MSAPINIHGTRLRNVTRTGALAPWGGAVKRETRVKAFLRFYMWCMGWGTPEFNAWRASVDASHPRTPVKPAHAVLEAT